MTVDLSRAPWPLRQHQVEGVETLLKQPLFMLADMVGCGKSAQVIATAQILYERKELDAVVVLCPAQARGVWSNPHPALGETAKHAWPSIPNYIAEFSVNRPKIDIPAAHQPDLLWLVCNYEYARRPEHLATLLAFLKGRRFWLIVEEAWSVKDASTAQWKAAHAIRKLAFRVTLLNGTPVADSPLDLFAQMKLLDPAITGFKYKTHFLMHYAQMGGYKVFVPYSKVKVPVQIVGWPRLEELRARVAPYALRRTTRECFDLPPILEPVLVEARLTEPTWRLYKQMRDEMVAWLATGPDLAGNASIARQAITKVMRLSQITSGFLGGVEDVSMVSVGDLDLTDPPELGPVGPHSSLREIGREKLDALLAWLPTLSPAPQRLLVWCRFRAEVERTAEALRPLFSQMHMLYGQQPKEDRAAAIAALNPDIELDGSVAVVGNPQAGGAALNLAGASVAVYLSNAPSLRVRLQSMGRIDRPGQRQPIRYADIVAVGPKGQATIDSHILAALRSKEDIAKWTSATWQMKLLSE